MSPFLDQVNTDSRARVSLSSGSYGTGSKPGLKIVSYIDKASKPDKNGAMQHSFLVAATMPSRESQKEFDASRGNGNKVTKEEFDAIDFEGTAFFKLTLHPVWMNWEAVALAYNEAGKDAEGNVKTDYIAKAIADGDCTEDSISNARAHFMQVAHDKVVAANTPAEQMDAAILTQYGKELTQISIKIGTLMRLIDWKYNETQSKHRNEFSTFDVKDLVNTEFSGKVSKSNQTGNDTSEIDSVYSRK